MRTTMLECESAVRVEDWYAVYRKAQELQHAARLVLLAKSDPCEEQAPF